eukprot:m.244540 g.244540  ORF g.244540 m.244540 type:complete len:199 (-) comp19039_c0_seq1:166-762(-)
MADTAATEADDDRDLPYDPVISEVHRKVQGLVVEDDGLAFKTLKSFESSGGMRIDCAMLPDSPAFCGKIKVLKVAPSCALSIGVVSADYKDWHQYLHQNNHEKYTHLAECFGGVNPGDVFAFKISRTENASTYWINGFEFKTLDISGHVDRVMFPAISVWYAGNHMEMELGIPECSFDPTDLTVERGGLPTKSAAKLA